MNTCLGYLQHRPIPGPVGNPFRPSPNKCYPGTSTVRHLLKTCLLPSSPLRHHSHIQVIPTPQLYANVLHLVLLVELSVVFIARMVPNTFTWCQGPVGWALDGHWMALNKEGHELTIVTQPAGDIMPILCSLKAILEEFPKDSSEFPRGPT